MKAEQDYSACLFLYVPPQIISLLPIKKPGLFYTDRATIVNVSLTLKHTSAM